MLTTFTAEEVRSFLSDLHRSRSACDEGDFCSTLDVVIACHLDTCSKLLAAVREWSEAVFTGKASLDPGVELMFRKELQLAYFAAKPHEEHAYEVENECYQFERLQDLTVALQEIFRILKNWVTPQRSVSPGPRVPLSEAAIQEAIERLGLLNSQ